MSEKLASQLPKPTGYKLLIALPDPEEKTEGGIIKASQTLQAEEIGSIVGFVLEMGLMHTNPKSDSPQDRTVKREIGS